MKNALVHGGRPCRMLVMALMVALVTMLPACRGTKPSSSAADPRFQQLDSMLGCITDVDSLAAIVQQSHDQNDALTEMLALKYQGRVLRHLSRNEEAIAVHQQYFDLAAELADTVEMVNALNGLGAVYRRMDELSTANGYLYQALKLSDSYSGKDNDRALKARVVVLNGIGNIEMELCNYTFADSILRQALAGEELLGDHLGMAINYGNLGDIKRYIGDRDSAWVYLRKSMELSQIVGSEKAVALGHLHFGNLHEDERSFSHAVEEYKIAYGALKEQGDSWHWIQAGLALTRAYILLGEEAQAQSYLHEAEAEAQRVSSKEYQSEASMLHYELSLMKGNTQEALKHYIRGIELRDSIHGLEKDDELRSQHIDYERERSSGEMDVLNRNISSLKQSRNKQLLFALGLLLMAAAVIAALTYAIRVRTRTQRLMRQIEETRSLFFTNVVHQLRSPLTAIMGSIDNLLEEGRAHPENYDDSLREDARIIERQGKNLLTLVDRILEVGSVRTVIKDHDWRHVDAVTYVRMIIESYHDRCSERHIELTFAPREASVDIDTVPRYLNTIVGNLLENAINYSNDYGKIVVTTAVDHGMFTIRVTDDGMGISKNDLPHVFEPFYRSAVAEQLIDGIGIGLTVVRDMVMAMGGSVTVDSVREKGSVFTVALPCKRKGVQQRLEPLVAPVKDKVLRRERHDQPSSARVKQDNLPVALVVEDQSDVARLVGHALDKVCQVYYATDGEQGLAKACDLMPDLIVTDVKMPLMDGLEMCRILRKHEQLCHIPVIMLSARTADADRIRGIEAGADAYLLKPFVRDELLAWVRRLLDSCRRMSGIKVEQEPVETTQSAAASGDDTAADARFLSDFALELDKLFLSTGKKIDLDVVARKFKMGETQLRHKLQEITGKNVPAYITQLRMEKAMRLLLECPDCLIGDIAEQCGFQDVAYFSRVFRQFYGMTPTQARNQ